MASTKVRSKHREVAKRGWRVNVPKFNIMDYQLSMMKVLSFFSSEVDNKEKQAMAIAYWAKQGKKTVGLARVADGWFAQAGALAYLIDEANIALDDAHVKFMDTTYLSLIESAAKSIKDEKVQVKTVVPIVQTAKDKNAVLAEKLGAEIDEHIEQAFTLKGKYVFDVKDFLVKNAAPSAAIKMIGSFYAPLYKEIKMAGEDGDYQVSESYAWLGARGVKRMQEWIKNLIQSIDTAALTVKTTRKPRRTKEKPKSKIVEKVQYQKEDNALKMRSITPDNLVGASEVWIFNTQYRKIQKYKAQEDMKLSVKGTTLQNWSPENSSSKTVRHPETQLSNISEWTKRSWSNFFNSINSVNAKVTGRLNDKCIIIAAF